MDNYSKDDISNLNFVKSASTSNLLGQRPTSSDSNTNSLRPLERRGNGKVKKIVAVFERWSSIENPEDTKQEKHVVKLVRRPSDASIVFNKFKTILWRQDDSDAESECSSNGIKFEKSCNRYSKNVRKALDRFKGIRKFSDDSDFDDFEEAEEALLIDYTEFKDVIHGLPDSNQNDEIVVLGIPDSGIQTQEEEEGLYEEKPLNSNRCSIVGDFPTIESITIGNGNEDEVFPEVKTLIECDENMVNLKIEVLIINNNECESEVIVSDDNKMEEKLDNIEKDDEKHSNVAIMLTEIPIFDQKKEEMRMSEARNIDLESKTVVKIGYVFNELISTEQSYIKSLENGIKIWFEAFADERIPPEIKMEKYNIFGNIEYICKFHKEKFLPALIDCDKDAEKLGDMFVQFVENDCFYGYILFALYRSKATEIYQKFLERLNTSGDNFAMKSFFLQPIQRLPRYQLFLKDIQKILLSEPRKITHNNRFFNICKAEKKLTEFIQIMNSSMTICDILECTTELQTIQKQDMSLGYANFYSPMDGMETQTLFLVAKGNKDPERNIPINILHQGKFKNASYFTIYDKDKNQEFSGKIFIFERCIIYCQCVSDNKVKYRGHYFIQEVQTDYSNMTVLKLYLDDLGQQEIHLKGNVMTLPALKIVADLLDQIIASQTYFFSKTLKRNSTSMSRTSSCSSFISDSVSTSSDKGVDNIQTETFLDFHQNFLDTFNENASYYIDGLPEDVQNLLKKFIVNVDQIIELQREITSTLRFGNLAEQGEDVSLDVFFKTLHDKRFEVYYDFVVQIKHAEGKLMTFEQYVNSICQASSNCIVSIENFLYLPLEYIHNCSIFFQTCPTDYSSVKFEYIKHEFSHLDQRLHENFHIRKVILDIYMLNQIGLVKHSTVIRLDRSFAVYHLFLTKGGILCMKVKSDSDLKGKREKYSHMFFAPYAISVLKKSKKNEKRLNLFIQKQKTALNFESIQAVKQFCNKLQEISSPRQIFNSYTLDKSTFFVAPK